MFSFGWLGSLLVACAFFACGAFASELIDDGHKTAIDAVSVYAGYGDIDSGIASSDVSCQSIEGNRMCNSEAPEMNDQVIAFSSGDATAKPIPWRSQLKFTDNKASDLIAVKNTDAVEGA